MRLITREVICDDGYTAIVNGVEMDTGSCEYVNLIVEDEKSRYVKEAVRHFVVGGRPRRYNSEDESRFFFSKRDLDSFVDLFNKKRGNWDKVKCRVILDDCGEFFCYELYRIKEC